MSPITQKNVNHVDINWQQYKDVNSELTESSVHQIWVYSSCIEMKCNSSVVSKANSSTSLHFTECIQSDIAKKTFIFENHLTFFANPWTPHPRGHTRTGTGVGGGGWRNLFGDTLIQNARNLNQVYIQRTYSMYKTTSWRSNQ